MTTKALRLGRSARWKLASLSAGALLLMLPHAASAQGRLEAQYEASLAGIPVGKGAWNIEIGDDSYAAAPSAAPPALLKTIANGSGTGEAQGRIVNGALVPANYKASTTTSKKSETIHITLANGNVKEFGIEPEPPVDADRIPVTEAHKKGVLDPMTSSLVRVPGTGEVGLARGLPRQCGRVRRPPALRPEARFQAHGNGEVGQAAITARSWSARSISRRSRATSPTVP